MTLPTWSWPTFCSSCDNIQINCKSNSLLSFSGNPRKTRTQWTSWSAWSQGKLILILCLYFTFWKRYSINSLFTKYNFNMSHYFSIDVKLMIQHIFLRVLLVIEDHLDQEVFLVDRYPFYFYQTRNKLLIYLFLNYLLYDIVLPISMLLYCRTLLTDIIQAI